MKNIQKSVNDHTFWLNQILECGKNWDQNDRMSNNVIDKGDQICHMNLLFKDHNKWSQGDPSPC